MPTFMKSENLLMQIYISSICTKMCTSFTAVSLILITIFFHTIYKKWKSMILKTILRNTLVNYLSLFRSLRCTSHSSLLCHMYIITETDVSSPSHMPFYLVFQYNENSSKQKYLPKRLEGDGCTQREKICFIMALTFTGESCLTDHATNSCRHLAEKALSAVSVGWVIPSCSTE
jgi:hypothetical protein